MLWDEGSTCMVLGNHVVTYIFLIIPLYIQHVCLVYVMQKHIGGNHIIIQFTHTI